MIEKKIYILKKKGELKQVNRTLKKRVSGPGFVRVAGLVSGKDSVHLSIIRHMNGSI
jgi:hypothetical protein